MIRTGKFTRLNRAVFAAPWLAKKAAKSDQKLNLSEQVNLVPANAKSVQALRKLSR
ncbi:MAG: hypothetical protein ACFNTA_03230 [Campylobacter sp.]|uniref:hypothetical protein n=1 Tax=Campylobacter sp. TaxID=205 RepID=UPI00361A8126